MDDILKMKIIRDFDKLHYKPTTLFNMSQLNKIRSTFNPNYLILLELIKTDWLQKVIIPTKKFKISDLNTIDIDFLYDISLCHNIKITNSPLFHHLYFEDNELKNRTLTVQDLRGIDTKHFIKSHPFDLFYIYTITRSNARWKQLKDDKGLLRYERKLKLEQLKKVEIEL